jgi:O-antigen biosynthesis protein
MNLDLSVIIVNYNVKYFLEHCLSSVAKAIEPLHAEVFVVDNASTDGSDTYFKNRFPFVQFIYNKTNDGFAKGNNIAVAKAKGEYILFLNPDTIVAEDCFVKCSQFFKKHENCGALGVKMVDGAGNFLKESKRSFPSPLTSFYKLSGLSRLFPNSAKFSKYHLGHLSENETHAVDVLAGAFLMVKKEVLDKVGSFDEAFFMYGEDVDLSYRIQKAGYQNYYFADTTIIHFKGESTKRGSLNYVKMFYKAMSQFVTKHYGQSKAGTFNLFIQLAIFIRAGLASLKRVIRFIGLPIIDLGIILLCIWATKLFWFAKIKPEARYVRELIVGAALIYAVIYVAISFFSGLYDKPFKQRNLLRSAIISTLVLLSLYALLPETLRFSRGIIFVSAVVAFLTLSLQRWLLVKTNIFENATEEDLEKQTIVIANQDDYAAVKNFYKKATIEERLLGQISTATETEGLGLFSAFSTIQRNISFKEIVTSANSLSYKKILELIQTLPKKYSIKFYTPTAESIIGSDSKDTIGESITVHGKFRIEQSSAVRCKRMVDFFLSLGLLLFSPLLFWFTKQKSYFFKSLFEVLLAQRTFVGYCNVSNELPRIKNAIIANNGNVSSANQSLSIALKNELDYRYAKQYQCRQDVKLILAYYFK